MRHHLRISGLARRPELIERRSTCFDAAPAQQVYLDMQGQRWIRHLEISRRAESTPMAIVNGMATS
jgi:hypothetical protein